MPETPSIILSYVMSADGRISFSDKTGSAFTSRQDRLFLHKLRATADLIVVGAETVRRENPPFLLSDEAAIQNRVVQGKTPHPTVCVLTRTSRFPPGIRLFRQNQQRVVLAGPTPDVVQPDGHPELRIERIVLPESLDAEELIKALKMQSNSRWLVEGGNATFSAFIRKQLVDELHVTVAPCLLGGGIGATAEIGVNRLQLDLISCKEDQGDVFLHYAVRNPKRGQAI